MNCKMQFVVAFLGFVLWWNSSRAVQKAALMVWSDELDIWFGLMLERSVYFFLHDETGDS